MKIKIVRKIDKLARIVIPKDVRISLGLNLGDSIEISVKNGTVVLSKLKKNENSQ